MAAQGACLPPAMEIGCYTGTSYRQRVCWMCNRGRGGRGASTHYMPVQFPKIETTVFNHCNSGTNYF